MSITFPEDRQPEGRIQSPQTTTTHPNATSLAAMNHAETKLYEWFQLVQNEGAFTEAIQLLKGAYHSFEISTENSINRNMTCHQQISSQMREAFTQLMEQFQQSESLSPADRSSQFAFKDLHEMLQKMIRVGEQQVQEKAKEGSANN